MNNPISFPFSSDDTVALQLGPLDIRWYALSYIFGLLIGWAYIAWLTKRPPRVLNREQLSDFVTWAVLGIILGGRLGYVLFYMPSYYLSHPQEILFVWQGGMSFHGGLIGTVVSLVWFTHRRELPFLALADLLACATPIGLFLGRIANFINGELYGRTTDAPWAVVFPNGGPQGRHPSQLYEAMLEGLLLFVVLLLIVRISRARELPGLISGIFLAGYGVARVIVELYREPDAHLGFVAWGATMGQLLSIPIILAGLYLVQRAMRTQFDAEGNAS